DLPSAFTAVTSTRTVRPTSAAVSLYVFATAPVMLAQPLPLLLQRCHWYVNAVGLLAQPPLVAVSVWPIWNTPSIVGGEVVCGGASAAPLAVAATTAASTAAARTTAAVRIAPPPAVDRVIRLMFPPLSMFIGPPIPRSR